MHTLLTTRHRIGWLSLWLGFAVLSSALLFSVSTPAQAQGTPTVSYIANRIFIGSNLGAAPGSQAITIPELAASLAAIGQPDLLVEQVAGSGIWLLNAGVVISPTARLEVKSADPGGIDTLRLLSSPSKYISMTATMGGHLLLDGVNLLAWDTTLNAPDENRADGRSYLLAFKGGRLDILNSDVGYLGWVAGEGSGLSWRKKLNDADFKTGATGRIENSIIHHNYFGMYSYEAYGIKILHSTFRYNISYGIDPHDFSHEFEVAYNKVYENGNHGIIFSRLCERNIIHHNEVYNNALHGIMLDRGTNNNQIYENLVYNNKDGIAIFQSSHNIIRDNILRDNNRGIRINATYDLGDRYDGISENNLIYNNLIENSAEHGIYLYARADQNRIVNNRIIGSGVNGIYIRSGGNRVEGTEILSGTIGINITGGYTDTISGTMPDPKPQKNPSGDDNVVISSTISFNSDVGIRILGGQRNRIGSLDPPHHGNRIEQNGKDGISIGDSVNGTFALKNQVVNNLIQKNGRHGILINDATSAENLISRNRITGNAQLGIKISTGAQGGIKPPLITEVKADGQIEGTTLPNATLEVYLDTPSSGAQVVQMVNASLYDEGDVRAAAHDQQLPVEPADDVEGATFLGTIMADGSGNWQYKTPTGNDPNLISLVAIDAKGNSSAFGNTKAKPALASYQVTVDSNGQTQILVTGPGAEITLPEIATGLGTANTNLLVNLGNGIWRLNANLFIGPDVILTVSPDTGVNELQLRSERTVTPPPPEWEGFDYASFVYVRAHNGVINLNGVKVYSWDAGLNAVDLDYDNGRAYLLAKYDAALNITDSDIGYLGSDDGESYGISWRDTNETLKPDVLRTRVTGKVINSKIHHNYYGVYTFQASNMLFRGNEFYNNVRYGFDPHDYTHTVLVENNRSYNNGSHGFIISRGCNNFVFRGNIAYNNSDPDPKTQAHGFMLDPGSPKSEDPQAPSYENVFEGNKAYDNEGYGLRILGSINNEVLNNDFYQNTWGMSLESSLPNEEYPDKAIVPSTGNVVRGNRLTKNEFYGIYVRETSDGNTIEYNTISENGNHGIYLRSNDNYVRGNTLEANALDGLAVMAQTNYPALEGNQVVSNTIRGNLDNGIDIRRAGQTQVQENTIENNTVHGVYITDGGTQNTLLSNVIRNNGGYGVRVNGMLTFGNKWLQNRIFGNAGGGIAITSGANQNVIAPQLLHVVNKTVTGQAPAGATVQIFADLGSQGEHFQGQTIADATGLFKLAAPGEWAGPYLTAVTIDVNGNGSVFSKRLSSIEQPPTVNITSPATGASFQVNEVVTITATASDSNGTVTQVAFFANNEPIANCVATAEPYTCLWTPSEAISYTLTAEAKDNDGATALSEAVAVNVNLTPPPAVTILKPANNEEVQVGRPLLIMVHATVTAGQSRSASNIVQVEFLVNGEPIPGCVDTTAPFTCTWTPIGLGIYNLTARATDDLGSVGTALNISVVATPTGSGRTMLFLPVVQSSR
jgi:parallel beta-helix repeat protein